MLPCGFWETPPANEDAEQLSYYIDDDGMIVTTRAEGGPVLRVFLRRQEPLYRERYLQQRDLPGTTKFVRRQQPCTHNFCDPSLGCISVPATNSCGCEDGEFCTTADTCSSGAASGTASV